MLTFYKIRLIYWLTALTCATPIFANKIKRSELPTIVVLSPIEFENTWAKKGSLKNSNIFNIIAIETGGGKVNAAIAATKAILQYQPICVIQFGTAGYLDEPACVGGLAAVMSSEQCDYGSWQDGTFKKRMIRGPGNLWRPRGGWGSSFHLIDVAMETSALLTNRTIDICFPESNYTVAVTCVFVKAASGDQFIIDKKIRENLNITINAEIMDMETAATAEACAQLAIPFIGLRAITFTSADDPVLDFRQTANALLPHLADWLNLIIKNIDSKELLIEKQRLKKEISYIRKKPEDYDYPKSIYKKSIACFNKGNYKSAAEILASHLHKTPKESFLFYHLLSLSCDYNGRPDLAARVLQTVRQHAIDIVDFKLDRELKMHNKYFQTINTQNCFITEINNME